MMGLSVSELKQIMDKLEQRRQIEEEFHNWLLNQNTDVAGFPAPVVTVLLHNYCRNDNGKFEWLVQQLQNAYAAGRAAATPPA